MSKQFIIRGYHWGYNDEVFYPCGNFIKSVFHSEIEAQQALISLEREHWKRMDLGETDAFFDADDKLIQTVNQFTLEKCGKELFNSDDPRDTFIPDSLNDTEYMQFLKLAGLQAYKLTQFDKEPVFYSIWFAEKQEYFIQYDECSAALVYAENIEALKAEVAEDLGYYYDGDIQLSGDIHTLSHTPALFDTLVNTTKGLTFNAEENKLTIDSQKTEALFSINELLKQPLFEIKSLSVEEIKSLESEIQNEYGEDY